MPPAPLPHSHARRGDRPPPAMLPAALHDEPGTFPTSVAGVAAAPLRCVPPLSPRDLLSGSSAHPPSGGGSRVLARASTPGRAGRRGAEQGEARLCRTPAGSAACSNRLTEPCPGTTVPRTHAGRGSLCTRAPAPIALLSPTPCTHREPPPLRRAHTYTQTHSHAPSVRALFWRGRRRRSSGAIPAHRSRGSLFRAARLETRRAAVTFSGEMPGWVPAELKRVRWGERRPPGR